MHELNVMMRCLDMVQDIAEKNHASRVASITLDIGELSTILPYFIEKYYPLLIEERPMFNFCKLKIDTTEGIGECLHCGTKYNVWKSNGYCPVCGSRDKKILQGKEFIIKEVQLYDEEDNHSE